MRPASLATEACVDTGVSVDPAEAVATAVAECRTPVDLHDLPGLGRLPLRGDGVPGAVPAGRLPGVYPEWLGGPGMATAFGCRFPYVVGEMARGIATARMVVAAVRHGFMGFFGSAGLAPDETQAALQEIRAAVGAEAAWGANLIHSPDRPEREREIADLFIAEGVRHVSASAFMALSPEVVRLAVSGLEEAGGEIRRRRHVLAKLSRPEVARAFLAPPPTDMLRELAAAGRIEARQAEWASRLPVASAITVEADSGGHTDNRPLSALFPALAALRDEIAPAPVLLGAAGGLGTPEAVAAAFALGAEYVVTGSINQSAVESGLAPEARALLAEAGPADVAMAPAADMFERGVQVQVLARGTLFAPTARRLYELWRTRTSFEALEPSERDFVERRVLRRPFAEAWAEAHARLAARDPARAARAEADPRQQLAIVFRTHLFHGAEWARQGEIQRRGDWQIWCGPAMGAFNAWVAGSWLADPAAREVGQIGLNLLEGAARITRAHQLRALGVAVAPEHFRMPPRRLAVAP